MSNPFSRVTTRVAYGASQLPRIAWYVGHSLAVRRLSEAAQRRDGNKARPRAQTNSPVPDRRCLYADMAILLQQDLANIEAGLYPLPADHDGSLLTLLHRSRLFFRGSPRNPSAPREQRAQRSPNRGDAPKATPLLFAEFPFPDGRLDDGRFGDRPARAAWAALRLLTEVADSF
jgi:hypothetical protein